MKATIQTDGPSVRADFSDCILHRTGEFAGNLDLSVQFSPSVSVKTLLENLRVKLPDGSSLIDVAGYRAAAGGYEVTLYSALAPPGKDVSEAAVPASVELFWLSHSHDRPIGILTVKVSQTSSETTDTNEVLAPIQAALLAGRKVEAIKVYREATGKGLAEAKDAVEAMEAELRARTPERFQTPQQTTGCTAAVIPLFFGLLGVVLLLWGLWQLGNAVALSMFGIRDEGKVTKRNTDGWASSLITGHVAFDPAQRSVEVTGRGRDTQIGKRIPVVYWQGSPETARWNSFGVLYFPNLLMVGAGLFCMIVVRAVRGSRKGSSQSRSVSTTSPKEATR
jgi:hypothetical protein